MKSVISILLAFIFIMLILPSGNAADLSAGEPPKTEVPKDISTYKTTYDKTEEVVSITNSSGDIMKIKLISSSEDLCTFTEIFEITNFEEFTPDSRVDFYSTSVVNNGLHDINKAEWFILKDKLWIPLDIKTTIKAPTIETYKVVYTKPPQIGNINIFIEPTFRGIPCPEFSWWNMSWWFYKNVTIDHSWVSGAHVDFPVLIKLNSSNFNFTHAKTSGEDIRFVNKSGGILSHEIERWDSVGEKAEVWVKIPSINDTVNTTIEMYYGSIGVVPDGQNVEDVWDINFVGVWHLGETVGLYNDSTRYNNDGTLYDADGDCVRGVVGKIGLAVQTKDDTDGVDVGYDSELSNMGEHVTVELWHYPLRDQHGFRVPVGKLQGYSQYYGHATLDNYRGSFYVDTGTAFLPTKVTMIKDIWHYNGGSYNGINLTQVLNGAEEMNISKTGNIVSSNNPLVIGSESRLAGGYEGSIDEVRVSNITRSNDWKFTTYNSTAYPGFFIIYGTEHPKPPCLYSHSNNKTNNDLLDIEVNKSENVNFNVTSFCTIDTWNWTDDGVEQNHNFNNITLSWATSGIKIVTVNGTNINGTTRTVQWNVSVLTGLSGPVITTWWNSRTGNDDLSFYIEHNDSVTFVVSADQPGTWHWFKDSIDQNHNSSTISLSWPIDGSKTVEVYLNNLNGTTSTITWNIDVVSIIILKGYVNVSSLSYDAKLPYALVEADGFSGYTNSNGYYEIVTISGNYTVTCNKYGFWTYTTPLSLCGICSVWLNISLEPNCLESYEPEKLNGFTSILSILIILIICGLRKERNKL